MRFIIIFTKVWLDYIEFVSACHPPKCGCSERVFQKPNLKWFRRCAATLRVNKLTVFDRQRLNLPPGARALARFNVHFASDGEAASMPRSEIRTISKFWPGKPPHQARQQHPAGQRHRNRPAHDEPLFAMKIPSTLAGQQIKPFT